MTQWHYPGPERRQYTPPRWVRPEWKSLAWVTQLLVALDCFFAVMIGAPRIGAVCWWLTILTTALVLVLVSVLAVKR